MNDKQVTPVVWPLWLKAQHRAISAIEADLAAEDLPALAWYDVLWTLEQAPGQRLRMADLAAEVLLTRSNLTRLVDRIEAAGLLRRELCHEDRRGFHAVLTEAGRAMRQRMWPVYRATLQRLVESQIRADEQGVLSAVFTRILEAP